MLRTSLTIALLSAAGCTDLVTVDVGADRIEPVTFEADVALRDLPPGLCPAGERPIDARDAVDGTVSFTPVLAACRVAVHLEDALIVDRASTASIAEALVGIDVEVIELDVAGGTDEELALDGATIAASDELPVRAALPQSIVDAFLEAVDTRSELRADVGVSVRVLRGAVPPRLGVRIVLQPILRVDVVRAAL